MELAKSDAERAKNLIATKAISQEDFDTKTKTYAAALATLKAAHAAVDSTKLNLEFTEVRSPIDGRTSRAAVTEGNLISGGAGATMLTTVVSQEPLYCYVDVGRNVKIPALALAACRPTLSP